MTLVMTKNCCSVKGYADHMLPFELLSRDSNENEMPNEDKEFIKSRLKDSAFTSFRSYNYNSEINLTKNKQLELNNLSIIKISS